MSPIAHDRSDSSLAGARLDAPGRLAGPHFTLPVSDAVNNSLRETDSPSRETPFPDTRPQETRPLETQRETITREGITRRIDMPAISPSVTPAGEPAKPMPASSGRSPLRTLTGVQILGTGSYTPDQVVKNEDLAALGCDTDWIVQRTGIRERRKAPASMSTCDMAYEAAKRCIEQAGVSPTDIDLVIVGTFTGDHPTPSTACILQHRLGITAPAMDLNAACAGFIYSLVTGMQFVATGSSKLALIVGADITSRIANPTDTKTFPLFGDGAGAVLLGKGNSEQGLLAYTLGSEGAGSDLLKIPAGGSRQPITPELLAGNQQYLQMEGRAVFKWAVRLLADSARDVLGHAGLSIRDVDLVLPHQANARIIEAAAESLELPPEKVVMNLQRYGNTSAGSIPLVLDEANRAGRIRSGDRILIAGFGAGLAWGTALLRW